MRCTLVLSNICVVCSQEIKLTEPDSDASEEKNSSDEGSDYYDSDFNVENDDFFFEEMEPLRRQMMKHTRHVVTFGFQSPPQGQTVDQVFDLTSDQMKFTHIKITDKNLGE